METRRARTMMAGQEKFQVTRPRISAMVPRWMNLKNWVKRKNMATPKISSGMTYEKTMTKLKAVDVFVRQRLIPMAKATPRGTAMMVVRIESRMVCSTALRKRGLWKTELTGSPQYQRVKKPCHTLCDLPLLKEKRTARPMGRM